MDISQIVINEQSSICIDIGKKIYIDPFRFSEDINDADYILFTHDHRDHFSPFDINLVIKEDTILIAPEIMEKDIRKYEYNQKLITVKPGESYKTDDFKFETVPMYNLKKPFHDIDDGFVGYILTIDGKRLYISGDIDKIPEAVNVKCDIAFVPIGGFYTMDYKEAAELINEMKPGCVIPTHYGCGSGKISDGDDFEELIDPDIEVVLKLLNFEE